MNYLAEIKAFYDLVQVKQLSTGQIALWNALMYINNKCSWIEWFTVPNLTLELNTGMSRSGVLKARNSLKQLGLIDFKTNGTRATSYKMNTIAKSTQESNQDSKQIGKQDSKQVSVQDGKQDSNTLNKLNETKRNINKLNEFNLYNNFDENLQCDCISKSTKNRCQRRSIYNINGKNYCNQHSKGIIEKYLDNQEHEKTHFDDVFTQKEVSDDLKKVLLDFIDMRRTIKKPMTSRALELLIDKARKMTTDESMQIAILNQSIERCWQTIYPLKEEARNDNSSGNNSRYSKIDLSKNVAKYNGEEIDDTGLL